MLPPSSFCTQEEGAPSSRPGLTRKEGSGGDEWMDDRRPGGIWWRANKRVGRVALVTSTRLRRWLVNHQARKSYVEHKIIKNRVRRIKPQ